MSDRPLILGHRGAPPLARENTVASFLAALDEGADGVELDVQASAEGALVLHHDTAVGGVPVHHLRYDELRSRLGEVSTLDEALAALPATAWVFVEIKRQTSIAEAELPARIAALVAGRERTWVGSFDPWLVHLLKATAPGVKAGWIVDRDSVGARTSVATAADVVSMEQPLALGPFLDGVHAAQSLAWPVDAPEALDACFDRWPRLTGVITKRPGLARARWEAR